MLSLYWVTISQISVRADVNMWWDQLYYRTAERSPPLSCRKKSMNPGRSMFAVRRNETGFVPERDAEKHGMLWLLWTSLSVSLFNTFPSAGIQCVDLCKEAEPKSILLKPVTSKIQWTIDYQTSLSQDERLSVLQQWLKSSFIYWKQVGFCNRGAILAGAWRIVRCFVSQQGNGIFHRRWQR